MILPPVVTIIVSKSGAPAAFKVVGVAFLIIICGCSFLMEQCPELAVDVNIRHRPILMQMVDKYVEAHTGYQGMEVTADGVLCKDAEGNEVLVPENVTVLQLSVRSVTACARAILQARSIWDIMQDWTHKRFDFKKPFS